MAVFEVFKTDNEGTTWFIIKNDIDGTFPCGGESADGRIWCFYVAYNESTKKYDLKMVYSDNQGTDWESPADIVADIDEAQLGWREDETGKIWVSYWKTDKPYVIYTNDRGENWSTPIEVKE